MNMKTFNIEIEETLSRTIEIQARNEDEAIEKVNQQYDEGEIVLDADDFSHYEINAVS